MLRLAAFVFAAATAYAESLPQRVETFLQPRQEAAASDSVDATKLAAILARPDPGTFFLRYAYGLKQHAKKLLNTEQTARLLAVIDTHTPAHTRWHDERNTLRCQWTRLMWQHAAASDAEAPKLRAELVEWMRLRMLWTQQEHLAQVRYARAVWQVLTPEQQAKLIAGEWKQYAKQDTGHTRGDATAKIITRALGKPDDKNAFEAAVAAWSEKRAALHAALAEAENRERRIVFAMDLNSESMAQSASKAATEAYAALYTAEADTIRTIVRAAYREPTPLCQKAAVEAWNEATKRFQAGASELIQLISEP